MLVEDPLVLTAGSGGTRVVDTPPTRPGADVAVEAPPLPEIFRDFTAQVEPFQMGIPAQDEFPVKTWSRIIAAAARDGALSPARYPDPRGDLELRKEIAAYVAIARGISCSPSQIIVTTGYGSALGLVTRALGLEGRLAWVEDPGYPLTRTALGFEGLKTVPIPVDDEGMIIADGIRLASDATLTIVTPGQQAPLGMTMSLERRHMLLNWAAEGERWIIEDDYLGELQLKGRAAPALAAMDPQGRVLHIGTFSKTISPTIRLGFLIVPKQLSVRFGDAAASIAPAPTPIIQAAIAAFLREGHHMRHLRRIKRVYIDRRDRLIEDLGGLSSAGREMVYGAGTTVILALEAGLDDIAIARKSARFGLAPAPLSTWYASSATAKHGLLLSVTNYGAGTASSCAKLHDIIRASA